MYASVTLCVYIVIVGNLTECHRNTYSMCFFDHLQLRLWNSSRRLCLFILCGPHSNGDHLLGFSIELLTRGNNYRLLFSNSDDRKNNLLQGNEGGKKQGTGQSLAEEFPEDFQRDLEETYDGKSC